MTTGDRAVPRQPPPVYGRVGSISGRYTPIPREDREAYEEDLSRLIENARKGVRK